MIDKVNFDKNVLIIGAVVGTTEYWEVSNFDDKDAKYQEEINILFNKLVGVNQVLVGDGVLEDYLQNHLFKKIGDIDDNVIKHIANIIRYYLPDKKNLETITTVKLLPHEKSDSSSLKDKLLENWIANYRVGYDE